MSSIVQFGGIGALEGPQDCIEQFRDELQARRDLFFAGLADAAPGILSGEPPDGAFYAFVQDQSRTGRSDAGVAGPSLSWAMAEHLIKNARIGCVPGVDFGPQRRRLSAVRFARERKELQGRSRR